MSGIFYDREQIQAIKYQKKNGTQTPPILKNPTAHHTGAMHRFLPHIHVSANVNVVDTTSRTTITQIFVNDTDEPIPRSSYCFPLYDGSVIVSFYCWFGNTTIEAIVKPKDQARREFAEAVARQQATTLLEEHTPEVFETALGNIPPLSEAKVEIVYLTELKADVTGDGVVVTIPTSIAPRYGEPEESYTTSVTAKDRATAEPGLKITVDVTAPVPIRALSSRSHPITVELGSSGNTVPVASFRDMRKRLSRPSFDSRKARATLTDKAIKLEKDFVLIIQVAPSEEPGVPSLLAPRAVLETCPKFPGYSAVKVAFTPRDLFIPSMDLDDPGMNNEIILLLDRSGSMESKIPSLRRALRLLISGLPSTFYINIDSFGSSFQPLWPQSRLHENDASTEIERYLEYELSADLGGTEILSAIKKSVAKRRRSSELMTQVIIFTDGEVWAVEEVLDYIRKIKTENKNTIRIYCLGIGDEVSHRLVDGIGKYGGGYSEIIAVESSASWDERVIRLFNGILTPSDWQCEVSLNKIDDNAMEDTGAQELEHEESEAMNRSAKRRKITSEEEADSMIRAPHRLPVIYGLSRSIIYFLMHPSKQHYESVTITGTSSLHQKVAKTIELERVEVTIPTIGHLAVKAIVNDLETGHSWLHDQLETKYGGSKAALQDSVILAAQQLGMRWNIPGKWASFVGVRNNQEEHGSRIYECDRRELTELTRSRNIKALAQPQYPLRKVSSSIACYQNGCCGNSTKLNSDEAGECTPIKRWLGESPEEEPFSRCDEKRRDQESRKGRLNSILNHLDDGFERC